MIEKYGLFDSLEGDEREYAEVDFARLGRVLGLDGVRGGENALSVSAAPAGLGVTVAPGLALIQGRYYELEDDGSGTFTLNLSEAGNNPRIDRIVLTLDFTARTVKLGVLKGAEAASPAAPSLTRNTSMYMLSLAKVRVAVGAGALDADDITDERHDEAVCGIFIASADSALAAAQAAQTTANAANASASTANSAAKAAQTTANSAASAAAAAQTTANGKASRAQYSATLTTSGWSSSAPYTQSVTISGVLAADTPVVDLNMSGATADTAADIQAAWACVGRIVTAANKITAYCYEEKPTVALPLNILVVR